MSVFDVLQQLNALDFNQLSKEERQAAQEKLRLLLDKISQSPFKNPDILTKKIALFKIWQKLYQLKIRDEIDKKAQRQSLKISKKLAIQNQHHARQTLEVTETESTKRTSSEEHSVSIKINEDVEVDGLTFEHGTVVDVPEKSADKLIATEKTEIVE